nr:hypothetical protein [Tanacetum cinerariifolium]
MSDSDESRVTHTDISSPFEEFSDIGSPRADDHEHLMLPEMLEDLYVEVALQAPPSPDFIPGPEEPEQAPPSPDYVPCLEHADDEIVAEDQPYAEDASPITQSPEYVLESDFEAHPEDDDDEDPKEDPVDYLANGGDDGDDEEGSSEDDEDDDMDIEADEEEEEEYPAPADSVVVASTAADQAPSVEETKPFKTDESAATPPPHPAYRMTARISIPAPVSCQLDEAAFTSSPPLQLPSASHRENRPEVTLSPQKRLGIALSPRYKVGESSSAAAARPTGGLKADYGFVATMDREIMRDPERERLGCPEKLGYDRQMWVILFMVRRQTMISELLRTDHRRSTEIMELRTALQGQVTALQAQAHPKDNDGEDPEEDPVDYLANGGDDGDDEEESSEDDEDDDMDIEADEEQEEEHLAPADSVVIAPTAADQALSAEETEPFKTYESAATPSPHPAYRRIARISIPAPIPFPPLPPILSPPSPVLSPAPPPSLIRSLGYRAAMIRLRDEAASTSSPPLQLPSASHRDDRPEVTLPPRKRLDIALGPRYEVGESSSTAAARPAGGQMSDIRELQAADRKRQTVISELLRIDHRRSTDITELRTALQG